MQKCDSVFNCNAFVSIYFCPNPHPHLPQPPILFVFFYMHDLNLGKDSHQQKDVTCRRNKQGSLNPFSRGVVLAFQLGKEGGGGKRFTALRMTLSLFPSSKHHNTGYWVENTTTSSTEVSQNIIVRVQALHAHSEMEVQLHSFLTPAIKGVSSQPHVPIV